MARVSGWVSPSSPARAVAAPPRLPSPPCSDLAATATAADPRPWPRSRGGGRRGTAARWNRRTGAEGLPRGVVETSSDRFLRSLWDSTSKHADTKMAKATLLVYCTSPFVYWSCHQSHIVEISDSEFQFRCLNGQFLTASNQDVISATTDSPGDSETFYIERNNTMLHIKLSNGSYLQVTDNNQLTSNYRSQPGWGDDMATFQMTIAANNLHGDYQLANGYRPVQAKAVLTEHRQNTIPEMRTALVASKSAGPYLIALCLYMIAARFF